MTDSVYGKDRRATSRQETDLSRKLGSTRTDPTEHIRRIIIHHRKDDRDDGAGPSCGCGAEGLPDHSHHLVQEIVDRLGLTQESAGDRSRKIRYVSACFDDELTKLEGAE